MNIRIQNQQYPPTNQHFGRIKAKEECIAPSHIHPRKINTISSNLMKGAYGITSDSNKNKIPFTANPLYKINIKKSEGHGAYSLFPANFSELNATDSSDQLSIFSLKKLWNNIGNTSFTNFIANDFFLDPSDTAFYAVEANIPKANLSDRITCLMETTNPHSAIDKSIFKIKRLQSAPDIVGKQEPEIKGSGELSIYGAVKLAKEFGFQKVYLYSTNNSFYEHIKMKRSIEDPEAGICGHFEVKKEDYDEFLNRIEKKYGIRK